MLKGMIRMLGIWNLGWIQIERPDTQNFEFSFKISVS